MSVSDEIIIAQTRMVWFFWITVHWTWQFKCSADIIMCLCAFRLERPSPKWPILCRAGR